jgi:RNA polymerase sigma factor (sigma-70 family)
MTMLSEGCVDDDFAHALIEARNGDQAAWERLFHECYPKVRRVVRRRLTGRLRVLYDSTDFASDVMKSLAAKLDHLNFLTVDALMAFLAQAAEKKVIDEYRKQRAQKRGSGHVIHALDLGDEDSNPIQIPAKGGTPSQVAVERETEEELLDRVSETEQLILRLRKENYSNDEIARIVHWNIRKVQRFLQKLHASIQEPGVTQ